MASRICVADPKGPCGAVNLRTMEAYVEEYGGGVPEAPIDDKMYGRKNESWLEIGGAGAETDPVFLAWLTTQPFIQEPEIFIYSDLHTNIFTLKKEPVFVTDVYVLDGNDSLYYLQESDYDLVGNQITVNSPTLSGDMRVKVIYSALNTL